MVGRFDVFLVNLDASLSDDAKNTRAYGPGLQREGLLQMQPAEFKVDAPADTTTSASGPRV